MNDFEKALKFVMKWEGFISDNPYDSGGLTIWGISSRSHPDAVREMKKLIDEGNKAEALKIAQDIYYHNYWLKADCDKLTYPLNIIQFDTAVNCGVSRANKLMIASLSWQEYLLNRIEFYTKLKDAKYFIRGWVNRVIDLYQLIKGS